MKIQCNVCEAAEARVLCCADEAALCWDCDEKVHAANKLAGKHQRVPLSAPSSAMPKCDICQETVGYFFCLEDRALLCRKCDLAIHTANAFVSGHQRFLLTGVKVGLESTEPLAPPSSSGKALSEEKRSEAESPAVSKRAAPIPPADEFSVSGVHAGVNGVQDLAPPPPQKVSFIGGGSIAGSIPQWQVDEYIGLSEFHSGFDYMGNGSSKADSGKLGESDSPVLRAGGEELDDDECLGQVPDSSWTVPQIPSPPTASGLYWPRSLYNSSDYTVFVPDLSYSQMQNGPNSQSSGTASKRRRQF